MTEDTSSCSKSSGFGEELDSFYDAYICYARANTLDVERLARLLEPPEHNLSLFIEGRNFSLDISNVNSRSQFICKRCRHMVIILSPEFIESLECEFLENFAARFTYEQNLWKLIPIVIEPCEIPQCLRDIPKIYQKRPFRRSYILNLIRSSISKPVPRNVDNSLRPLFESSQSLSPDKQEHTSANLDMGSTSRQSPRRKNIRKSVLDKKAKEMEAVPMMSKPSKKTKFSKINHVKRRSERIKRLKQKSQKN